MATTNNSPKDRLERFFNNGSKAAQLNGGLVQENMVPQLLDPDTGASNLQLGIGSYAPMLDVATPAVYMPATIVVLSLPLMYLNPDGTPSPMGETLKVLLESHAKSVSGLDVSITTDSVDGGPIGHDGQQWQVPGKTKRSQPSPNFTFQELTGGIIWKFFRAYQCDLNDPDTNACMTELNFPHGWTSSVYSFSFMAIQFDPTGRPDRIMHAIEYANCWPQGVDGAGVERQIGTANSRERSITFNAIAFENDYITYLAMKIAESLQIHKARYTMAPPPHSEIDESIAQIGIFQDAAVRVPGPGRRNDNSLVWGFVPNGDKLDDSMPRTGVRTPESNGTAVAQSDKVEQWGPVNNTPFSTKNDSTMISGGATGASTGQA